jgi:NADH-quinone oxidoreductase subunit C
LSSPEADVENTAAEVEVVEEAAPVDVVRDGIVEQFTARLGAGVVETLVQPGVDVWVRVARESWADAARAAKDLGYTYFCFLSAIDWMVSPFGKSEDDGLPPASTAELQTGVAGGETRFQLLARVESPVTHLGVTLKTDVPTDDLSAPTWSHVYAGADWHESETWEMFGIGFDGHAGLRHMYLPGDFEGHPLRKDFPLISRMVKPWPGLVDVEAMPGEPEGDADADAEGAEGADA